MFLSRFKGRYTRRMEDKSKVELKVKELSSLVSGEKWIAAEGFHAYIAFSFKQPNGDDVPNFTGNSGIPVKLFINTTTGEVKTFAAQVFKK